MDDEEEERRYEEKERDEEKMEESIKPEELQGLLCELNESKDEDKMSKMAENILQITKTFPSFSFGSSLTSQLHVSAVTLWNKAVVMKSASSISLFLNAQLRQLALTLVFLCTSNDNSEQLLKKQITMAIKTGRAWLECDNPVMAETSLELANQFWERLRKNSTVQSQEFLVLHFKVLCSQAETSLGLDDQEKALKLVQRAKEIFTSNDKEMSYLSMFCYNCGLQQYQCGKYSNAVQWLKESYDIGRGCLDVGPVKQARTLRLLANSYLEWDGDSQWQKALNAVGLANTEHSHLAGHLLKLTILLQYGVNTDRIATIFKDILSHSDLKLDVGVKAVKLAIQFNQTELALSSLQSLQKILKSPSDQQTLKQLHLELLLDKGMIEGAKELIESFIENHVSSEPLDAKTIQQFHIILWRHASKSFNQENYQAALDWYRYSLALFPANTNNTPNNNMAKLQRNIATCYIELRELSKAKEAIELAIFHDRTSAYSHYLSFKIAVLLKQKEEGVTSLQTMMECVQDTNLSGLLAMAAQLAFENNNRELAIHALESVVESSSNTQQILTSLRCLIRLKLTFMKNEDTLKDKKHHLGSLLQYAELARGHLSNNDNIQEMAHQNEAMWFAKITWNIALEAKDDYKEMKQAFNICQKMFQLLPSDKSSLNRRKICHLMVAAASLQVARKSNREEDSVTYLRDVISHVQECRNICQSLEMIDSADPTLSLLILYEFEAQLLLKSPDALRVLDTVKMCPNVEPKIYENIAALAVQMPPKEEKGPELVKRVLRTAIDLYKRSNPSLNIERISHCTHSLVQILIGSTEYSHDFSTGREEAKSVLFECIKLMETIGKYSEIETLWHMAKTWNTGIHLYSVLRYKEAEEWCSLGMKFLTFLPQSLTDTYRQQMTSVYTEILDKLASDPLPNQLH